MFYFQSNQILHYTNILTLMIQAQQSGHNSASIFQIVNKLFRKFNIFLMTDFN